MKKSSSYPVRLPTSLKNAAEQVAREDGSSLNEFIVTAVAEKLSALRTQRYFAERAERADLGAFDRFMRRPGGAPPRDGDEIPNSTTRTE
jgi:hypothetical protein